MPTTTSEQFKFDEYKNLSYKLTTTTTNNNGVVTEVSIFRRVYAPTTSISSVPSAIQSQCQIEWTPTVQQNWKDKEVGMIPEYIPKAP